MVTNTAKIAAEASSRKPARKPSTNPYAKVRAKASKSHRTRQKKIKELRNKNGLVTTKNLSTSTLFEKGNPGGPGRPRSNFYTNSWKAAARQAVTPEDVAQIIITLIVASKKSQPWAVRDFLDRFVGSFVDSELEDRIKNLEEKLEQNKTEIEAEAGEELVDLNLDDEA